MSHKTLNRVYSVDILRSLAATIIRCSLMEPQLGRYAVFATDGSFGDSPFFFCSGYTLSLSNRNKSLINWYKNCISRIYPTNFSWAVISGIILSYSYSFNDVLINGRGYFIKCIMRFYLFFYPVMRLSYNRIEVFYVFYYLIAYFIFFFIDCNDKDMMYLKCSIHFIVMILGAILSKLENNENNGLIYKFSPFYSIFLLLSAFCYYALMYVSNEWREKLYFMMPLFIISQIFVTYFSYILANRLLFLMHKSKVIQYIVFFISGLCLDIYIVQSEIIYSLPLVSIFPVNIIIFGLVIISAYLLRAATLLGIKLLVKEIILTKRHLNSIDLWHILAFLSHTLGIIYGLLFRKRLERLWWKGLYLLNIFRYQEA